MYEKGNAKCNIWEAVNNTARNLKIEKKRKGNISEYQETHINI